MPVKISNRTNPKTGEITDIDRILMKVDFEKNVKLKRLNYGNVITKKFAWYITKDQMETFLREMTPSGSDNSEVLEINFAVNSSIIVDECSQSIGDCATVVIELKDKNKKPIPCLTEYLLIPGFGTAIPCKTLTSNGCCPSSKPGSSSGQS